ncbi:MAG: GNAT family N-acetyltransferase [Chloroflexi bacterium]|nr:GNAT family N-acetyltransferase [Chloroflexota bacterium]
MSHPPTNRSQPVAALPHLPVDLGDGLLLRAGRRDDADRLTAFNGVIHAQGDTDQPDETIEAWAHDLLARPHPTMRPEDFTVVEHAPTGTIVSSLNLIPQTWSYGGIELPTGRVEMVGTLPEYRRRGLVRRQFDVVHTWSAARGQLLLGITGIPWYYRQFGYEMAMTLGGARSGPRTSLPKPKEGAAAPFQVRPATLDDLDFIAAATHEANRRYLVSCIRDAALWRYEMEGKSEMNTSRREFCLLTTPAGERTGLFAMRSLANPGPSITAFELAPGTSWLAATPLVLRFLAAAGEQWEQRAAGNTFGSITFALGADHPAYRAAAQRLPRVSRPYAWYLRVPDLPALLRRVAPVLEQRLAASDAAGHSGELRLSFYRDGLRLVFESGRLVDVVPWPEPEARDAGASFPGLTFLQALFGYRSLDELEYAFPDCRARTDESRVLVDALFPKQPSHVWPVA